jgi:hypothetical protein
MNEEQKKKKKDPSQGMAGIQSSFLASTQDAE